ncbi:MAG: DUF2285 domain-containing protein [Alphaproteobacteria bacterium]|nr:DUF2285 domain-containing protein [Alphaproteobacteria bacterium]
MIENLAKLSDLSAGKLVTRSHGNERLGVVLQALDGALAGASQREIAVELFGAARVRRDWGPDGGDLRDVVRRAIRRGRYLLNGGYLGLLRRSFVTRSNAQCSVCWRAPTTWLQ